MTERCTRVDPWVFCTYTVRYVGDKEDTIKPLMGCKHCARTDTVRVESGGLVYHRCPEHPMAATARSPAQAEPSP